ncbi:hypothetical protein C8Q80DRAFT_1346753 [Daedaleopsis nitida]|nr:hypothetical protein C8Q80DRAFT_1346753 [Daedaleopsis nitida]
MERDSASATALVAPLSCIQAFDFFYAPKVPNLQIDPAFENLCLSFQRGTSSTGSIPNGKPFEGKASIGKADSDEDRLTKNYPNAVWCRLEIKPASILSPGIREALLPSSPPDVELAFNEMEVSRHARGPPPLSLNPIADDVPEYRKPFSACLGVPIEPLSTPLFEGTGGMYLKIGNDIVLLTCAHVVRPPPAFPNNSGMRRVKNNQPREYMMALGTGGYNRTVNNIMAAWLHPGLGPHTDWSNHALCGEFEGNKLDFGDKSNPAELEHLMWADPNDRAGYKQYIEDLMPACGIVSAEDISRQPHLDANDMPTLFHERQQIGYYVRSFPAYGINKIDSPDIVVPYGNAHLPFSDKGTRALPLPTATAAPAPPTGRRSPSSRPSGRFLTHP